MMTSAELLILLVGTIGAVASAIVTVMNGVSTRRKLEVIHSDTNGNLSEVKLELAMLKRERRGGAGLSKATAVSPGKF